MGVLRKDKLCLEKLQKEKVKLRNKLCHQQIIINQRFGLLSNENLLSSKRNIEKCSLAPFFFHVDPLKGTASRNQFSKS